MRPLSHRFSTLSAAASRGNGECDSGTFSVIDEGGGAQRMTGEWSLEPLMDWVSGSVCADSRCFSMAKSLKSPFRALSASFRHRHGEAPRGTDRDSSWPWASFFFLLFLFAGRIVPYPVSTPQFVPRTRKVTLGRESWAGSLVGMSRGAHTE